MARKKNVIEIPQPTNEVELPEVLNTIQEDIQHGKISEDEALKKVEQHIEKINRPLSYSDMLRRRAAEKAKKMKGHG